MPRIAEDLNGLTFGGWTVLSGPRVEGHSSLWLCRCSCGKTNEVRSDRLKSGSSTNCGCLGRKSEPTSAYYIWLGIKRRCSSAKDPRFADYGGRGITMHPDWADSFDAFISGIGDRPSPDHSVDRIDNDGNYEPGNCRWATKAEQARNTSRNHAVIRSDGVRFSSMVEAEERTEGATRYQIRRALKSGKQVGGFHWRDAA